MKNINNFLQEAQNKNEIQSIFGGKVLGTGTHDDDGVYEDEWDDKDNSNTFSSGDTICYNV